jgi:hypothetical protein
MMEPNTVVGQMLCWSITRRNQHMLQIGPIPKLLPLYHPRIMVQHTNGKAVWDSWALVFQGRSCMDLVIRATWVLL